MAGDAMHWFDLPVVVARLRPVLDGPLAVVNRYAWHPGLDEVRDIIRHYSRAPDYDPDYSAADDLTARQLWHHGLCHNGSR